MRRVLTLRAITTRFHLPANIAVWLLEAGIALALSCYVAYVCYRPLARALSHVFAIPTADIAAAALLCAIVMPLLWLLLMALVLHGAGLLSPTTRVVLDVLLLAVLIAALAVPALREIFAGARPDERASPAPAVRPVDTGPLNAAPEPLRLERIPLGAELWNTSSQPVDVNVWFVTLSERGRTYCAGKPLAPAVNGRSRLGAGERLVFMSGNCQRGSVGLTVWDTSGRRIYQSSVVVAPAE